MRRRLTPFILLVLAINLLNACATSPANVATKSTPLNLEEFTVQKLHRGYLDGTFKVQDVVNYYLQRIEQLDQNGPQLHAVISTNPNALTIAKSLDSLLATGASLPPLFGVPILIKDNIDTKDPMPTTAGSRFLAQSFRSTDSKVVRQLRAAGAIILGKANLSEWANFRGNGSTSGWSGVGGLTKNPYRLSHNSCGSSSGSGVATAANLCMFAIGTETNGSIVCPSSVNGVVGIKPTVGLASRTGIIPISFTMDTPGPMARTVEDAARCLGALTDRDDSDPATTVASRHVYSDYTPFLKTDGLKGKRIGWSKASLGINAKVDVLTYAAVKVLQSQGAEIVNLDAVLAEPPFRASFQVMLTEFKSGINQYLSSLEEGRSSNLEDLIFFNEDDSIELNYFDQALLQMAFDLKDDTASPKYQQALQQMHEAAQKNGIDRVMHTHNLDAIIGPTTGPAWETNLNGGDSYEISNASPAAMAGYPHITLPMGMINELPVGLSFYGRAWSEPVLIEMAYSYEQATQHRKVPKFLEE